MRLTYATALPVAFALTACGAPPSIDTGESAVIGPVINPRPIPIPLPSPQQCYNDAASAIVLKSLALLKSAPGALGGATSDIETIEDCGAYRRRFQRGSIFYVTGASDAFSVHGDIAAHYAQLGEQNSPLGYPTTDESGTPDGIGRFNHFQHGSIYWKPNLGPHALWGSIRDTWANNGWERNPSLGYPISDERAAGPSGNDQMVSFENGVVYHIAASGNTAILNGTVFGKDAGQVQDMVKGVINDKLGSNGYVESVDPIQVSDYSVDGAGVHNRRFTVTVHNHYKTPWPAPDGWGTLTLELEVYLNRGASEIDYSLLSWNENTTDYGPGVADSINSKINAALQPIANSPQQLQSVPVLVQEVKPMADGSLDVYISPAN
jgi:hypothetical protein